MAQSQQEKAMFAKNFKKKSKQIADAKNLVNSAISKGNKISIRLAKSHLTRKKEELQSLKFLEKERSK